MSVRRSVVASTGADPDIVIVAKHGDIVLRIKDATTGYEQQYQCSRMVLRNTSEYFNVLLDPTKFAEGIAIEEKLQDLYQRYNGSAHLPSEELPRSVISDVGPLPKDVFQLKIAFKLFLEILHNSFAPWPVKRSHSTTTIALLAIVADHFDALTVVTDYIKGPSSLPTERKSQSSKPKESLHRQNLLAGLIFNIPDFVRSSSAALIVEGSQRWYEGESQDNDDALWWRLPRGIEEELLCRREHILETIGSMQTHFIELYASKKLQCKMGYDSSPQCDSFQLGEQIRFFTRKGTLQLQSTFSGKKDPQPYTGDVHDLLVQLRECPAYQLDKNHSHCGLRSRIMPLLFSLWPEGQVGICLACWNRDMERESWLENPTGGKLRFHTSMLARRWESCEHHERAKAVYTADDIDWTPPPS